MDQATSQQAVHDADACDYGSDVTASSTDLNRIIPTAGPATLASAQTSFLQPDLQEATSDYGSDIDLEDEQDLKDVFARIEGAKDFATGIEVKESELDDDEVFRALRLPKNISSQDSAKTSIYYSAIENQSEALGGTSAGLHPAQGDHAISTISFARLEGGEIDERPGHDFKGATQTPVPDVLDATQPSDEVTAVQELRKSPLHRFRASRPLSVSDLVSPTWCELQYSKNLNKHGKIPRSAAMKKGGEVHKKLELEVHDFVPVEVRTKEDAWGLRIWNIIQGLRTLRTTGMTRELDVWGVVDGELVSGVIDELSFSCPDPELEMSMQPIVEEPASSQADPDQMTIDEFFAVRKARQDKIEEAGQQLYLLDTKTRAWPNLPTETSMRPTRIQLMLYRHLLSLHATNAVPGEAIFARYNLDSSQDFSPQFIDDIAKLEHNFSSQSDTMLSTEAATVSELRTHPNLEALWGLMATEFVITFADIKLSPILTAVYRTQASGSLIGQRTFVHNDTLLAAHVADELQWWRGEREPRGVQVEEDAFKCKMCEFADDCAWRLAKEAEAVERNRERRRKPASPRRKRSVVDADVKMEVS